MRLLFVFHYITCNMMVIVRSLAAFVCLCRVASAAESSGFSFCFAGTPVKDQTVINADQWFDSTKGFGFEKRGAPHTSTQPPTAPAIGLAATVEIPKLFSVRVGEGVFRVTATLGDPGGPSDTTIKAESRRIVMPPTRLAKAGTAVVDFLVEIHTANIDGATSVRLNDRERLPDLRHWDDKLTLEFCGAHPVVQSVNIERIDDAVTVFIAGDSTVTDQAGEPWAAWGQLIPQFFGPKVAVSNYAESGRTLQSFKGDRRWEKLLSRVKPGDYVFIQFGHNDMKEKGDNVGPWTSFSAMLRSYVADVRQRGAMPVVMTPMHRRRFKDNAIENTFGEYPDAIRKVATDEKAALIDLQAMSKPLYDAFGPEQSKQLFVHYPANTFAGQEKALRDDTHFNAFGAEQIARCVIEGIRAQKLPLADFIRPEVPAFDPAKPGDPATYDLPSSAVGAVIVPEGR